MYTEAGHCPRCGAPIWVPTIWNGITPPPAIHSCMCFASDKTITTSDTI